MVLPDAAMSVESPLASSVLPYIFGAGAAGVALGWWLRGSRKEHAPPDPKQIRLTYFESKFYGEPIRLALFGERTI